MVLIISVAVCFADFVTAFQPSSVQHHTPKHIRSTRCGGGRAGCGPSLPTQSNSALNMFPLADVAEHAADFSTNMLLAVTASSSASARTTTMISSLDVNDFLYKAQSMASDMASSTGIFGGSASELSEGGANAGGITATSLAILYGAGLLTSFSPCSLSLLPLTVSYISASTTEQRNSVIITGERNEKLEESSGPSSLLPTLAFAAGLASVFVGLGLSVALAGAGVFGATTQGSDDGTINVGKLLLAALSSGVSIAMGLQLLELVRIPFPSFELDVDKLMTNSDGDQSGVLASSDFDVNMAGSEIAFDDDGNLTPITVAPASDNDLSSKSSSPASGGSLLRTFLLGGSSALIASPCATPVLASILAYVATSRDPFVGAILLFTYTLGYSTPLLVIGATGGQALANAQAAAALKGDNAEEGMSLAKIGRLVTPLTASVLIWYGTTGFLEAMIGDPSLVALAPILD